MQWLQGFLKIQKSLNQKYSSNETNEFQGNFFLHFSDPKVKTVVIIQFHDFFGQILLVHNTLLDNATN